MLSGDKPREIRPGDRITADYLNQLRDGVRRAIVGGKGINVSQVGKRIVIERKRDQIIRRGGARYGNIWKLTTSLGLTWLFDQWEVTTATAHVVQCGDLDIKSPNLIAARRDAVANNQIHTMFDAILVSLSDKDTYTSAANITSSFGIQRIINTQLDDFAFVRIDGIHYYDNLSPPHQAWLFFGSSLESYSGLAYDSSGGYFYTIGFRSTLGGTTSKLYKCNTSGLSVATNTLADDLVGPDMLLYTNSALYLAGVVAPSLSAATATFQKMSTSGVVTWGYLSGPSTAPSGNISRRQNAGGGTDIIYLSGYAYGVGFRSEDWTGSSGAGDWASVWKLDDSTGALVWSYDTGGDAFGVCTDGAYIYVCGERNKNWGAGTRYATIWKLDVDGALVATYDTGRNNFVDDETGFAYVIRHHDGYLYVGTQGVKAA